MASKAPYKKGHGNQRASIFDAEVKKPPKPQRNSVLSSLRATQIVSLKPALPAELISVVLDYVSPSDLISCAQVSRKFKEIIYDDSKWIQKLHAIGVWDEQEARQRQDEAIRKRFEAQNARSGATAHGDGHRSNGSVHGLGEGGMPAASTTLFDIDLEQTKPRERANSQRKKADPADGFDDLSLSNTVQLPGEQSSAAINALEDVRSTRGQARKQYGMIHAVLNPLYLDATRPHESIQPMVFRLFPHPKHQAQILRNLGRFGRVDKAVGCFERREKLDFITQSFTERTLLDFRHALDDRDADRMRSAVEVLAIMDALQSAVDTFVNSHSIVSGDRKLADPLDCVEGVAPGHVDLEPSQIFFQRLAVIFADQTSLIDQVFPATVDVLRAFLDAVTANTIRPFVDTMLGATHERGQETYLRAVPGVFEQCVRFAVSLQPTKAHSVAFKEESRAELLKCFEPHLDRYFLEELNNFTNKVEEEVLIWERALSEQDAQAESFFMSNINRQAAKRDFLSSFRKVVMMPINAVTAFPLPGVGGSKVSSQTTKGSRPSTPDLGSTPSLRSSSPKLSVEAPTTELAAKAAIMNSRLEGIKTLFSIEVALSLVHQAKTTIERMAIFVRYGDKWSQHARRQCEAIFIALLSVLGQRHIKNGFDKAVEHLTSYNPHSAKSLGKNKSAISSLQDDAASPGVGPLVTFLELVNVGDLIQQMVDVFYAQELVAARLTDQDDFMNPAAKEKKRFEQMLDERVAAGMSKGIDVLMDEVEFLCATMQVAADYNPGGALVNNDCSSSATAGGGGAGSAVLDIGPSETAQRVVALVEGHTSMLQGSTDKSMLDVFYQEVGLRLFGVLCKHMKRQRISVDGSLKLISDINLYAAFAGTLKQKPLAPYYAALRELSQIYLVDCLASSSTTGPSSLSGLSSVKRKKERALRVARAGELAVIIADNERYKGVFGVEEVLEFAERRADWYAVKWDVERAMYGIGCVVM